MNYLATVYNGIDLSLYPFQECAGEIWFFSAASIRIRASISRSRSLAERARLIIAGIVQDEAYFHEQIQPHLNGRHILYIGPMGVRGKTTCSLEASALLHLNTIPERFGLVLAEANAAGVPVIAMDLGSCREVIKDGKTGFLVTAPPSNSGRWTTRRDRPSACRSRVREHFSIATMVAAYEQVYSTIFDLEAKKRS